MLFNSLEFFVFLAITLLIYYRLNHRWQNYFLLGASYVFYGWWDWRFVGLMLLCSVALLLRHPDTVDWPPRRTLQRLLVMVVVLLMYAWGFEWLGFPIATAILTMVIGMLFNATLPAAGISGAMLGILLWYAFDRLLDVTLPLGAWFN